MKIDVSVVGCERLQCLTGGVAAHWRLLVLLVMGPLACSCAPGSGPIGMFLCTW